MRALLGLSSHPTSHPPLSLPTRRDTTTTSHPSLFPRAEIHKNKHAHIPVCSDVKPALAALNRLMAVEDVAHMFQVCVGSQESRREPQQSLDLVTCGIGRGL